EIHHVPRVVKASGDAAGLAGLQAQVRERVLGREIGRRQIEVSRRDIDPHVRIAGKRLVQRLRYVGKSFRGRAPVPVSFLGEPSAQQVIVLVGFVTQLGTNVLMEGR